MYVGKTTKRTGSNKWLIITIILLVLWILISVFFQRSPFGLISASVDYMRGVDSKPTYNKLVIQNLEKDSLISELETALEMLKRSTNYQQAVVNVESDHLNMRSKPALGAEVVVQLQVGAVIEVLYYDNETYRIGGEYGKWCKVKYADKEGWVWGNYIKIID